MKWNSSIVFAAAIAFVLAIGDDSARAAETGLSGANWGMTTADLDRVFGDDLTRLDAPLDFGPFYADRLRRDVPVGGYAFTAFPQMDRDSGNLTQVLLDIRRLDAPDRVMAAAMSELISRHGAPDCVAETELADGEPLVVSARWTLPGTTVHATLIDMNSPDILTMDPNTPRNVLEPARDRQRIKRSALPRRVVIRYHDAARTELSGGACDRKEQD